MAQKTAKPSNQKALPAINSRFNLFSQLLIVVITTTITTFPFIFDSFTVSKLFVLSIGLTFITAQIYLNKSKNHFNYFPKILVVILVLFVISIIVSWAVSGVPLLRGLFGQFGRGNGLFYYFFAILIFTLSVLTYKVKNEERAHQLITYLSWFMVIYATLQQMGIDIAKLDTRELSPVVLTFGNSNFAGGMLSVLFAYHFTYVVIKKKLSPGKISLVIALAVSSTFPAALQGYLIILFSILVGISFLIARKFKSPWVTPALQVGWVAGILLVVLGLFGKSIFSGVFAKVSFQARIEYWKISLKIMRDNLLFGVGPDKLYDVTSIYMPPGSLKIITTTRMDNAHNFYLNLGANYGFISMIFLLAILLYSFLACVHNFKDLETMNAVAVATSVAFMAMFIDGLVSLEQPGIGIWLYLFAGMAVAAAKSSFDPSIPYSDLSPQDNSKKSVATKLMAGIGMTALVLCALTIGNRVIFDGKLRSDVQTVLLNQGTYETLVNIESSAIRLASEPEYVVQSLKPLAEIGDARKLDAISEASYNYYPLSIQASLIRADVLGALGRDAESCSLRGALLLNTPWDFNQLQKFLTCDEQGFDYRDIRKTLISVEQYLPIIEESTILDDVNEVANLTSRLQTVSVCAKTYFLIGNLQNANKLQIYAIRLIERVDELLATGAPGLDVNKITLYRKLLDF
jgi:O-antigen ligase